MPPRDVQHPASWETTGIVIGVFYDIYNDLGYGLAEVVYERAMIRALRKRGVYVESQRWVGDRYGTYRVGRFRPDLIVNRCVVVEIKARSRILRGHWAQLINYLHLTGIEVGLVVNFGRRAEFKRLVVRGGSG